MIGRLQWKAKRLALLTASVFLALAAGWSIRREIAGVAGQLRFAARSGNGTAKVRIFCFGDSLTKGSVKRGGAHLHPYAVRLQALLGPRCCRVDWLGLSGWQTGDMVRHARDEQVQSRMGTQPGLGSYVGGRRRPYDAAVVMAGTNDLLKSNISAKVRLDKFDDGLEVVSITSQNIVNNLIKLYGVFGEAGVRWIVAVGIPDNSKTLLHPDMEARRAGVDEGLEEYAKSAISRNFGFTFVRCPVGLARGDLYEPAGVHFAAETYDKLASEIHKVLIKVMPSSTKYKLIY